VSNTGYTYSGFNNSNIKFKFSFLSEQVCNSLCHYLLPSSFIADQNKQTPYEASYVIVYVTTFYHPHLLLTKINNHHMKQDFHCIWLMKNCKAARALQSSVFIAKPF
jgi:hypothetical protein